MSSRRPRVLIVEDDVGVRHALERGLERSGFDAVGAGSYSEALAAVDHDLTLVDLGLPDGDGIELCRELRARHPDRPVIVVTGRDDELDVIDGLDAGADDYVTKPFSLAVMTVRIRRHLERASRVTTVGQLQIDRPARRATLAGEPLELTPREFDLLAELAVRPGEAKSKTALIATVWDEHWSRSTHTLAVHISGLRAKLRNADVGAPLIETVPGVGYRLDAGPSNR